MALDSDQGGSSKLVSGIIMAIFAGLVVVGILVFRAPRGGEPGPGAKAPVLQQPQVGSKAPEIEGEDIQGRKFKLTDYRGKVVMLDFWAHW